MQNIAKNIWFKCVRQEYILNLHQIQSRMQNYTYKNDKFYQIILYHSRVNAHVVYEIICSDNRKIIRSQ